MLSAGSVDRLTQDWGTTPLAADQILYRYLPTLRARSRERWLNDAYGERYSQMVETNVIGADGITFRSGYGDPGDPEARRINAIVEEEWKKWGEAENCDVQGKLSAVELQRLFVRQTAIDGEYVEIIQSGIEGGMPYFRLMPVDPELLDIRVNSKHTPQGGYIRMGVEYNANHRVIAYHFADLDTAIADANYYSRHNVRFQADRVNHAYITDMVGQSRGLPWLTSVLWTLRMLGAYEDAALVNARYGAEQMAFIRPSEESATALRGEGEDTEGNRILPSSPGEIGILEAGDELIKNDPNYPTAELEPFVRQMLRRSASGSGVSYNLLANDLVGVNYSSIRQGVKDEREIWKGLQSWAIEARMKKVFRAWIYWRATVSEFIPPKLIPQIIAAARWQPRRWDWVDPLKDAQAKILLIEKRLETYSGVIRESGREPDDVWREFADDVRRMEALGIAPVAASFQPNAQEETDDARPNAE